MTVKEKLRQYIENKEISMRNFSQKIDVSDGYLRTKGAIYSDVLPKISKVFPDLNMNWLLFDEGEMLLNYADLAANAKNPHSLSAVVAEHSAHYSYSYKDKYVELLEENRELQTKIINLLEINNKLNSQQ